MGLIGSLKEENNGIFTDEAVLYQDILKYALVIKKSNDKEDSNDYSFSLWELIKWLRYNHKNYVDRYNIKPLSDPQIEIESLQKGIKSKVDNFIRLDLIKPTGARQSKKGRGEITLYTYTEFGSLFAWILENDREDKAKVISEVYDLIQSIFRTGRYASSSSIFYSDFFKMCKQAGKFQDIVDLIRTTLTSNNPTVTTIGEFIQRIQQLNFNDPGTTIFFNVLLWEEIFNKLDPQIQNLVMYNLKMDLERRIDLQVKNDRNYEKLRFKVRDDPRSIALEGYCTKCMYYIPVAVDFLEYKRDVICSNTVNQSITLIRCPNCKKDKSFQIPLLN